MKKRYFLFLLPLLLLVYYTVEKAETDRIEIYDRQTKKHINTIKNRQIVNNFIKEIKDSEAISINEELFPPYTVTIYKNGKKATFDYTTKGKGPSIALTKNGGDIDYFIPEETFENAEKTILNANIFYLKTELPIEESSE